MALVVNSALIDRPLETKSAEGVTSSKRFEASLTQTLASRTTPVQRTRMSASTASAELRQAWTRVTGEVPDDKTVALITAQWAHETGHGASMYNYNFGGIKGVGPSGLSVEQRTKEGYGHHERQITDRFRAYESAAAGAEDYVKLLTHRFPEAVNAAKSGDAQGFVQGLKRRGYFTGDPSAYQRSITSISNGLLTNAPGETQTPEQVNSAHFATATLNSPLSHSVPNVTSGAVAVAQKFDARLVRPLMPTVLMNALSSEPSGENPSRGLAGGLPLEHVSTLSMVDEVLRASLQMATSDENTNRRGENLG